MRSSFVLSSVIAVSFTIGCGESGNPTATSATDQTDVAATPETTPSFVAERPSTRYDDPRRAVNDFLVAVKSGDDKTATSLLTTDAQKEAWSNGMAISAEGFPDAKFDISEVEYIRENSEAHVMSTWSDTTPHGEHKSFQCVWLLRAEAHGWCIYGMAAKFLENVQPIVLNFENQTEMEKRQQWAEEQIRAQKELEAHQRQVVAQEEHQNESGVQQAQFQSQERQQSLQGQIQSGQVPQQRQALRQAAMPSRSAQ